MDELLQALNKGCLWLIETIVSEIIGFVVGIILGGITGYNIKVKKVIRQEQEAGDNSKQQQEYEFDNEIKDGEYEFNLQQIQKGGSNSVQIQRGSESRK